MGLLLIYSSILANDVHNFLLRPLLVKLSFQGENLIMKVVIDTFGK